MALANSIAHGFEDVAVALLKSKQVGWANHQAKLLGGDHVLFESEHLHNYEDDFLELFEFRALASIEYVFQ